MYLNSSTALLPMLFVLSGCASMSPPEVANPKQISVQQALNDVATGLVEMKKTLGSSDFGMIASDVEIVFDISAKANDSGSLTLSMSKTATSVATAASPGVASVITPGAGYTSTSEGSTGNKITIKFKNILTLPKDTLGYDAAADGIEQKLKKIKAGMDTFAAPVVTQ